MDNQYNPNPIDLYIRIKEFVKTMNEYNINIIKDKYRNREIKLEEKKQLITEYQKNAPIIIHYTKIVINIPLEKLTEIITNLNDKKYEIKFPYPNMPNRN
jgi:hypothetical protein